MRSLALILLLAAAPANAFLFWRDSIDSRWSPQPVPLTADDSAWSDADVEYEPGIDFRAKNDSENLYLHLTADGVDGRALMSGAFRQDLTFWFFTPDGKARSWGLRIPFSRLGAPLPGSWQSLDEDSPIMAGAAPEMVRAEGVAISTAALPDGVRFHSGLFGKDPIYTLVIPIKALRSMSSKPVRLDFQASPVGDRIKRIVTDWDRNTRRSRKPRGGGSSARPDVDDSEGTAVPDPVKVKLAVRLSSK